MTLQVEYRTGIGFDAHRFVAGRPLRLGGINIPWPFGLKGHSDADVLLHAIADALLGAAGMGDIGKHFPDTDDRFKDIDSGVLIGRIVQMLEHEKIEIVWVDVIVIAEKPKILPYVDSMCSRISELLKITSKSINIKGKTMEGMGWIGRNEGIAAQAVVTVKCAHGER